MKNPWTARDVLAGMVIYPAGDTLAALVLGRFSWTRLAGIALVGATLYALEIPHYFRWIDRRTAGEERPARRALLRTAYALVYFNPLWIARHLFFIRLLSPGMEALSFGLLAVGFRSWLVNIPLSALGNYVIQVKLPLGMRFMGSAVFSGLMALYYALSEVWFGG